MPNKKSIPNELIVPGDTIGKRKEEDSMQALSLQDVFSDSGSATGSSQKTSLPACQRVRPSDTELGKAAQLEGKGSLKINRNPKGGRKKLQQKDKRSIKLQAHVTKEEHEKLIEQFQNAGMRYLSDYLRLLILDTSKAGSIINNTEVLKQLDKIGVQIHRIGNNINQIAKYANIQLKSGKIDQSTVKRFNSLMEMYLKEEGNLIRAYRALARNKE